MNRGSNKSKSKAKVEQNQKIIDYRYSIQEDSILEDMCEMASVEFDGDPESMTLKDKSKLLKRLRHSYSLSTLGIQFLH